MLHTSEHCPLPALELLPSHPLVYSRAGTPTAGGLLAPPTGAAGPSQNQGSIALHAMRSVRSLARIGSWAQLKNARGVEEGEGGVGRGGRGRRRRGRRSGRGETLRGAAGIGGCSGG